MPRTAPFEQYVARYEAWFQRHRWAYQAELAAVQSLWPGGKCTVEIGVGTGRFAQPLSIPFGVEPATRMARVAVQRAIRVVQGVAEYLPIASRRCQAALMVTTICFVDDLRAALEEAHRILQPGGALVIGYVDRNSFLGREYEAHKGENVFYSEATFYATEELVALMQDVGFVDFAFRQTIFHPLDAISANEPVEEGWGRGAFVVVRARSPE